MTSKDFVQAGLSGHPRFPCRNTRKRRGCPGRARAWRQL